MEEKATTFTITIPDKVSERFQLGANALGITTEEAINEYIETFWVSSENLNLFLGNRLFDTREEAQQLADRCNRFFHDARRNKDIPLPVASVEDIGRFVVIVSRTCLSSPTRSVCRELSSMRECMAPLSNMRYGTEHVEFEAAIVFKDRRRGARSFYVRAVVPVFVHEDELFVQAVGDPEFKLILRDCAQKLTEHDLENFVAAVKSAAEREYKKTFA